MRSYDSWFWLTSLNMVISRSVHIAANGIISFDLWLSNIPLCIYTTFLFIHLSLDIRLLSCFGSCKWCCYKHWINVSFQITIFSRYVPRSGVAGSYGSSVSSFWSNLVLVIKNLPAIAGDIRDTGLIPGLGRSPGRWHGNPLQYSCLENPMDRGAWQVTVHRGAKSQTWLKWLYACIHFKMKKCWYVFMLLEMISLRGKDWWCRREK